eukprot:3225402-Prymnesium_polylepis.1
MERLEMGRASIQSLRVNCACLWGRCWLRAPHIVRGRAAHNDSHGGSRRGWSYVHTWLLERADHTERVFADALHEHVDQEHDPTLIDIVGARSERSTFV